jgi:hypothetical protein
MKMGMKAVAVPKSMAWDEMMVAKTSTPEAIMPSPMESTTPRTCVGIGCAAHK